MTHEDLIIQTLRGENKELKKKLADMRNELCWLCGRYKTEYDGTCEGCRWRDMA